MRTQRSLILQVITLLLLLFSINVWAGIGAVQELKGVASITRDKKPIDVKPSTSVNSNDVVQTGNGVVGINFDDNTKVRVTENSKLVIDDFVYDPKSKGSGKLALKVAMGTVRYASGNIAHDNNKNVAINTPTATVAVRGTAFTMTVDEIGQSLIVLLPNPDGSVGRIDVNSGGVNYKVGDEVYFGANPSGTYGYGAAAAVTEVSGSGAITKVKIQSQRVAGTANIQSVVINGLYDQIGTSLTTSATTVNQVALSLNTSTYRSAKIFVQASAGSTYHAQEIMMMHDGTNVYMTEYAMVNSGAIGSTFDGDISGGNMRFLVTPTYAVTTYKIACSAMRI